ncbi:hypothetical protein [Streptomyces sp. NPDC057428]
MESGTEHGSEDAGDPELFAADFETITSVVEGSKEQIDAVP